MKKKQNVTMGSSIAIGVALGAALGIALDNLAIGIALGIAIGAAIGGGFTAAQGDKEMDETDGSVQNGDE
jgi:hypothetical protein